MEVKDIASENSLYLDNFEIEAIPNYSSTFDSHFFNYSIFHRRKRIDFFESLKEAVNHIDMQDKFTYVDYDEFALAGMPKGFTIQLCVTHDVKLEARVKFKDKFVTYFDEIAKAVAYTLGDYDD